MQSKTCRHCGKEYQNASETSLYCGMVCRDKAYERRRSIRRNPPVAGLCSVCGCPFERQGKGSMPKTCGMPDCVRAHKARCKDECNQNYYQNGKMREWKMASRLKRAESRKKLANSRECDRMRKADARELAHDIAYVLPAAMRTIRDRIERETGMLICSKCGKEGKPHKGRLSERVCAECGRKAQTSYVRAVPVEQRRKWYSAAKAAMTPEKIMAVAIRDRTRMAIRTAALGKMKGERRMAYLGCTPADAARYIEAQFRGCMSWNNYGRAWHIDHVIPVAHYDMNSETDRAACFHYTNLQPLWAKTNMRKGDTRPNKPHQPMLLL